MAVKQLFPIPPQFVDANGDPYSGALLFFYAAGSSTKQNTYTDSGGGTACDNPITLNSSGYPAVSGTILAPWGTVGETYKIGLAAPGSSDPPASFIWTEDNVSPINDSSVSADQWVSGPAPTYVSATQFTLVGDQTSTFHVGRRVKTTNSGGTVYGYISVSAYTSLTTITVVNDSGTLDAGLSAVSYGLLSSDNPSTPLLTDAYPIVSGSADKTKKLRFEVDGFTTATTRVLTPPDANLTLPDVTAAGDLVQASSSGVLARLAIGAANTRLRSTGTAAEWQATWYKVGSLTRNSATASGAVAYTGVGFVPKAIAFTGGITATTDYMMVGFTDGATNGSVANNVGGAGQAQLGAACVFIPSAAGTAQTAVLTSFDADGFTLTWTKTGSPTAGTATVYYLALR